MVIFSIVLIECLWFVVAIFDLVHDVEAIYGLCLLWAASGNIF